MPLNHDVSSMTKALEDYCLAWDVDALAAWTDAADSPLPANIQKMAREFVRRYELAGWARQRNEQHGMVVLTATLLNEYNRLLPGPT